MQVILVLPRRPAGVTPGVPPRIGRWGVMYYDGTVVQI